MEHTDKDAVGVGEKLSKEYIIPAKSSFESFINYRNSTLQGLRTVISRAHAMTISLVLMWSITSVSISAATNFVYYKQSVSLLPVHGVASTI